MSLKAIFKKPVDRPIEGVIKADDSESLRLEVEEYVLTNEVQMRLEEFLDAYNDYQGANGVWLSGFFRLRQVAPAEDARLAAGKPRNRRLFHVRSVP